MRQTELTFSSGALTLSGTLATPSRPTGAAALLTSGSGPIDRDSNAKRLPLAVASLLAEALGGVGVATLRYDKRGVGASEGDYHSAGMRDNIDDARAALEALRRQAGVDPERVVLIGHSEGALIALDVAAGGAPAAGLAMLAGSARTGEEVLRWQAGKVAEVLPAPVRGLMRLFRVDVAASQAKRLAAITASTDDVMRVQGFVKLNAKWLREFMAFDPEPLLAALDVPVLAVTGGEDIQVDPADVGVMRGLVSAPFEGHVVPGVNHILRAGDPAPNRYKRQVGEPLDSRVTDALTSWVTRIESRPRNGAPFRS